MTIGYIIYGVGAATCGAYFVVVDPGVAKWWGFGMMALGVLALVFESRKPRG